MEKAFFQNVPGKSEVIDLSEEGGPWRMRENQE